MTTILVTRPLAQAKPLLACLEAQGYQTIHMPTLAIVPIADLAESAYEQQRGPTLDVVIWVSANAVHHSINFLQPWLQHGSTQVAAIGQGTRRALEAYGVVVHWVPTLADNTEGLLALPYFRMVKNKQMLLIKGEGGRDVLAATLLARGALLHTWCCYRRCCPNEDIQGVVTACERGKIDLIVSTSCESLYNLKQMFGQNAWPVLQHMQLLVISPRMLAYANVLGFKKQPLLANGASSQVISQTINHWLNKD